MFQILCHWMVEIVKRPLNGLGMIKYFVRTKQKKEPDQWSWKVEVREKWLGEKRLNISGWEKWMTIVVSFQWISAEWNERKSVIGWKHSTGADLELLFRKFDICFIRSERRDRVERRRKKYEIEKGLRTVKERKKWRRKQRKKRERSNIKRKER